MATKSPSKRRVLGALDPNMASPRAPQAVLEAKKTALESEHGVAAARSPPKSQAPSRGRASPLPREDSTELKKRSVHEMAPSRGEEEDQAEPVKKRPCLRDDAEEDSSTIRESPASLVQSPASPPRNTTASPEASSVFDNSINDTSHATAVTEPDEQQARARTNPLSAVAAAAVAASGPPRRPPGSRLTPEQTRETAERIRLRLGLAAYKVRTGQTDVPLEQLRVLPMVLPGAPSFGRTTSSAPAPAHALPPTAQFACSQQQQPAHGARDHRRPLPGGISLSTLGRGGETRPSPEEDRQQPRGNGGESKNDTDLRSSPPPLPAAPATEESPEGLPRLQPRSTTTAERDAVLARPQPRSATTVERDAPLPRPLPRSTTTVERYGVRPRLQPRSTTTEEQDEVLPRLQPPRSTTTAEQAEVRPRPQPQSTSTVEPDGVLSHPQPRSTTTVDRDAAAPRPRPRPRTTAERDEALPAAANGLLSLARG